MFEKKNELAISVIMSIFNEPEKWLRESIESILKQTFTEFEFIIINDNPDRELNENILNEYKKQDDRIIIIKNDENIGLTKSLNLGLNAAKGKYIARMDADDISLPGRFQFQFEFMEANNDCVVCGTQVNYIGDSFRSKLPWLKEMDLDLKATLIWGSIFAHPTVFLRHSILKKHKINYNEDFIQSQDYRLWIDLYDKGTFYNIQKILLQYRKSNKQISSNNNDNQLRLAKKIRRELINVIGSEIKYNFQLPDSIDFLSIKKFYVDFKKMALINNSTIYLLQVLIVSMKKKKMSNIFWMIYISIKHGIGKDFRALSRLLKSYRNENSLI